MIGIETAVPETLIDGRALSKLQWRCRRGLLENDLFVERFFERFAGTLTDADAQALGLLMDLGDNDLLDLNLGRKTLAQVNVALVRDDVQRVLGMLRKPIER